MENTKVSVVCSNCGGQMDVNPLEETVQCPFCGTSYAVSKLLDESDAIRIEKIKLNAQQKIEEEKLKHETEKNKSEAEKEDIVNFKKSKFSKVLIIFSIIGLLLCANAFHYGRIFAGLTAGVMVAMFVIVYLMRVHILKEPKKGISTIIAIIAFVLIIPYFSLSTGGKSSYETKASKIDVSNVELKAEFPVPDKLFGKISTDRKDLLSIEIDKITKQEYKEYVNKVIKAGYIIDIENENWDTVYDAYNSRGYNIRVIYSELGKDMSITLKAPRKMETIEWPTTGLGSMLPATKSTYGDISWNNSETFIVYVGNTTIAEYNNYVKECENKGFTVDYKKDKKYYSAKNSSGYELTLRYSGANVIEISLRAPKEGSATTTPPTGSTTPSTTTPPEQTILPSEPDKVETPKQEENKPDNSKPAQNNSSNEIRKDFKDAMDSYEKFMDEYVAFMKKYQNSNGTDLSLITDYAKYMSKYADMCKSFEKWGDEEMNTAETAYYIDVQTRVNKKLLEVAQ